MVQEGVIVDRSCTVVWWASAESEAQLERWSELRHFMFQNCAFLVAKGTYHHQTSQSIKFTHHKQSVRTMHAKTEPDCSRNSVQTIENGEFEPKLTFISTPSPYDDSYEIDHRILPFIFRFNYAALQKLRMSRAYYVPTIAHDIFYYLKDKLVVGRYSEGSRYANRMKYEEKIKFVIRAFDHGYAVANKTVIPNRCHNFNRQSQVEFFRREEVKKHFLQEIQKALIRKKEQNQRRIRYLQRYIEMVIDLSRTDIEAARQLFQQKIKRKQLPWTDNMFMDISQFSRILYVRYTKPKLTEQKRILQMGLGQDGQWEMIEKLQTSWDFDLDEQGLFDDERTSDERKRQIVEQK